MTTLFSLAFGGIFLAFVTAAIIGHVLVIEALVRPFFGRLALTNSAMLRTNRPLPQTVH